MAKPGAAERARRMLALLHHFEPGSSVPLERLAELVGADPEDLAEDIATLSMCGVAPYYPDDLVSVFVEDGLVHVWAPLPALDGAVRLSPDEARALAAALQAAGFEPTNALTQRLLEASSAGFSAEELAHVIRSAVAGASDEVYKTIALGIERSETVLIAYRRLGSEEEVEREIQPIELQNERGNWYVAAHCLSAGAPRTFRLDRIRNASATGKSFSRGGAALEPGGFRAEGLPTALLSFKEPSSFTEREWPGGEVVEETASKLIVKVPYSGTAWITRMAVSRLGSVEVLEPQDVRDAVAALAIQEIAKS